MFFKYFRVVYLLVATLVLDVPSGGPDPIPCRSVPDRYLRQPELVVQCGCVDRDYNTDNQCIETVEHADNGISEGPLVAGLCA